MVNQIKDAHLKEENKEAERMAHSIKGVAGNVGAMELAQRAADLESCLKQGKTENLSTLLESFSISLNRLVRSLDQLLPAPAEKPDSLDSKEPATHQELAKFLENILPHLEAKKPKPAKQALEKAGSLKWPANLRQDYFQLSKLIKKYKFKEAVSTAEALLQKMKG
jgi:two-component system sensor histidine kinase/response regulator